MHVGFRDVLGSTSPEIPEKQAELQVARVLNLYRAYTPEAAVGTRRKTDDDWTIERWRTEPRLVGLEFSDTIVEKAPSIWRDLTVASAVAILLWAAAAVVFG